jgi:hypothetical protein
VHRCNFIPTPEEIEEGWRHTFLHDKNPWPKDYRSEVWLYGLAEDGGQIDLEVILYDEDGDRAPELISELQGCGFSARIVSEPCPKYGELSPP